MRLPDVPDLWTIATENLPSNWESGSARRNASVCVQAGAINPSAIRDAGQALSQIWANVCDVGQALKQRFLNLSPILLDAAAPQFVCRLFWGTLAICTELWWVTFMSTYPTIVLCAIPQTL